jgi:hypothetical protein
MRLRLLSANGRIICNLCRTIAFGDKIQIGKACKDSLA